MDHGVFHSFEVSASGLSAQRRRLDAIADNIANAQTTRTAEGGPYKRREVALVQSADAVQFRLPAEPAHGVTLARSGEGHLGRISMTASREVRSGGGVRTEETRAEETRLVYEPGHPDADGSGMVAYPEISVVQEMIEMILASRAYEANVTAIQSTKAMIQSALEI
ncbi:MAG: flagellar basal body rod protein FlgC [bacterium]